MGRVLDSEIVVLTALANYLRLSKVDFTDRCPRHVRHNDVPVLNQVFIQVLLSGFFLTIF